MSCSPPGQGGLCSPSPRLCARHLCGDGAAASGEAAARAHLLSASNLGPTTLQHGASGSCSSLRVEPAGIQQEGTTAPGSLHAGSLPAREAGRLPPLPQARLCLATGRSSLACKGSSAAALWGRTHSAASPGPVACKGCSKGEREPRCAWGEASLATPSTQLGVPQACQTCPPSHSDPFIPPAPAPSCGNKQSPLLRAARASGTLQARRKSAALSLCTWCCGSSPSARSLEGKKSSASHTPQTKCHL